MACEVGGKRRAKSEPEALIYSWPIECESAHHLSNKVDERVINKNIEYLCRETILTFEKIKPTLEKLGITDCIEVKELAPAEVAVAIELLMKKCFRVQEHDKHLYDQDLRYTRKIRSRERFKIPIPSRDRKNQRFVKEVGRFVLGTEMNTEVCAYYDVRGQIMMIVARFVYILCETSKQITKRDLYYKKINVFKHQWKSNRGIDDLACLLRCSTASLKIFAAEKGMVVGCLEFVDSGIKVDCRELLEGKSIPSDISRVTNMKNVGAKFILIVEKHSLFWRLSEDKFHVKYPCIIVTGKGQPDVGTRLFLNKMYATLKLPVLALTDFDPYGVKILCVYTYGSLNLSYGSANLSIPDIVWLGCLHRDIDLYKIPEDSLLKMTKHDIDAANTLIKEEFMVDKPLWREQLELMIEKNVKYEIQALNHFSMDFLATTYLPMQLQLRGWI